ncbi:methylosome subunit pICln-like [Daktulosphaira vitifoliae]|uniref:methylosome subunit pICln-like n=1 Tax=Daktulosphaira vitifoliae TaxID=58002 RepID=UPI0021A9D7B4|nr:methylosome subunit pICln-like [Daktulosphaira vitifoliae]
MDINASFNEEDEVIQHCEPDTYFIVDEISFGKGILYVADSKLYWKNNRDNQIVSIDYKSMCVFGTCNHPTVHEKPCLQIITDFTYKPENSNTNGYFRQNGGSNTEENADDSNSSDEALNEIVEDDDTYNNDDEEELMKSKIKLVPDNAECLTAVYNAITHVQPLHSTNEVNSDEEGEDYYYNEDDEFEDYEDDNNEQNLMN